VSGNTSSEDETRRVADVVAQWRRDPEAPVYCPRCGEEGLCVIDRSARPFAEWYVVSCAGCQLETTLQVPLAGPGA
jgi:hypothetical protein